MKKTVFLCLALILALCTLCSCAETGTSAPPELTAADFADGNHPRDAVYAAAFETKTVTLDALNIHFAASLFDAETSPDMAEQIAADAQTLQSLGKAQTRPVDVYLVVATTTGGPVVADGTLFCTAETVKNGGYLPYLASCLFDLTPWWQCVGLSQAAAGAEPPSAEKLAKQLKIYANQNRDTGLLSLAPCYFAPGLADENTRTLARAAALSLTEYLLDTQGMEEFLANGCDIAYRRGWLEKIGADLTLDGLDSPEVLGLTELPLTTAQDTPWLIQDDHFQMYVQQVDWMPDADAVYAYLRSFYTSLNQLYRYWEQEAPQFYAAFQQGELLRADITLHSGDYSSRASFNSAISAAPEDTLHELLHCWVFPEMPNENRWLCEGMTTYLSSLYYPSAGYTKLVDAFATDADADSLSTSMRLFRKDVIAAYEAQTGSRIARIYREQEPLVTLYHSIGNVICLHPEYKKTVEFPFAVWSVDKTGGSNSGYAGNQLSYAQAMVFTQYLIEQHGLDTMIQAVMDPLVYRELFPTEADFQAAYDAFLAQLTI